MHPSETTITAFEGAKRNDPQMLPVGATLQGGKYTVEAQLAHGGFGMTYKVLDRDREKYFALKELFIRGVNERTSEQTTISLVSTTDTEQAEQNRDLFSSQMRAFKREGDRMIDLQHPNIVRVYTIFEGNNTAYYVMDYVEGESLSARLKRLSRPLTEDELMPLLPDILSALEYIHERRIHHLDIKPANIMVDTDGHARLIDFGASKQVKSTDQRTSTLSAMALTRGYAPSEQVDQNTRLIGPWTDFYALGATLYKLLTDVETLPSYLDIRYGYEFQYPASVSESTRTLITKLMQPEIENRPQSVAEIRSFMKKATQHIIKEDKDETIIVKPQKVEIKEQPKGPKAEPQPDTTPSNQKSYIKYIITLCFISLLGVGVWLINRCTSDNTGERLDHGNGVDVPNVVGMLENEAREALQKVGLVAIFEDSIYDRSLPAGYIISQSPIAGSHVKATRQIYLTKNVTLGPTLPLPDVADNSTFCTARNTLIAMGFRLDTIEYVLGDKYWVYGVKCQGRNVYAGERIPFGEKLVLQVGNDNKLGYYAIANEKFDDCDDFNLEDFYEL